MMRPASNEKQTGFLNRVSVYGLEYAVAMITVLISAVVLSFAVYTLLGHMAYEGANTGRGYIGLWSSASTIVWVPVALIFYLRVRAHMARSASLADNSVQRVFTTIYDVLVIITIISFAVAAVYAAMTSLVKPDETAETLIGVAVPSLISALLFSGALVSFFKRPVVRRRTFAVVFSVVAAAIVLPATVVNVTSLRIATTDSYAQSDLYSLKTAIDDYSREKSSLPEKLVDVEPRIGSEATKSRLDNYTYSLVDQNRYELCTDFASKSEYTSVASYQDTDPYQAYANFSKHSVGRNCYKLRTVDTSLDYRAY